MPNLHTVTKRVSTSVKTATEVLVASAVLTTSLPTVGGADSQTHTPSEGRGSDAPQAFTDQDFWDALPNEGRELLELHPPKDLVPYPGNLVSPTVAILASNWLVAKYGEMLFDYFGYCDVCSYFQPYQIDPNQPNSDSKENFIRFIYTPDSGTDEPILDSPPFIITVLVYEDPPNLSVREQSPLPTNDYGDVIFPRLTSLEASQIAFSRISEQEFVESNGSVAATLKDGKWWFEYQMEEKGIITLLIVDAVSGEASLTRMTGAESQNDEQSR